MLLAMIGLLVAAAAILVFYQLKLINPDAGKAHLPQNILIAEEEPAIIKPEISAGSAGGTSKRFALSIKYKEFEQKLSAFGLRKRLKMAGHPLGVLEFYVLKAVLMFLLPFLATIFLSGIYPRNDIILVIGIAAGYLLPDLWLNKKIQKRQRNITRDLPNVIDLLNLCVSGGLDFMLAINRVVRDLRPCELTQELAEVYRETQIGKSRKEALKNLAERVGVPEVQSFVRVLIQADRMGAPIAEILKSQAEDMRVHRYHRGEAMALKAPIKLLLPLFAFILPVVLILVAGPIMIQFSRSSIGF